MFQEIDDFVIDRLFQPFSHKFQRFTGRDNFFLARCSLFVQSMFSGMYLLYFDKQTLLNEVGDKFFFVLGWIMISQIPITCLYIHQTEKRTANSVLRGCMNDERFRFIHPRSTSLVLLPLGIIGSMGIFLYPFSLIPTSVLVALNTTSYFLVCTPLPPTKGKVREWWTSLNFGLKATLIRT